jgi:hypothetical protein
VTHGTILLSFEILGHAQSLRFFRKAHWCLCLSPPKILAHTPAPPDYRL